MSVTAVSPVEELATQFRGPVGIGEYVIPKSIAESTALQRIFRVLGYDRQTETFVFDIVRGVRRIGYRTVDGQVRPDLGPVYEKVTFEYTKGDFVRVYDPQHEIYPDHDEAAEMELPEAKQGTNLLFEMVGRDIEPETQIFELINRYVNFTSTNKCLFILQDLSEFVVGDRRNQISGSVISRSIKNLASALRTSHKRVLFLSTQALGSEFSDTVYSVAQKLPGINELRTSLSAVLNDMELTFAKSTYTFTQSLDEEGLMQLCREGKGLTVEQFTDALYVDIATRRQLDEKTITVIHDKKVKELRAAGIEVMDVPEVALEGLDNFQSWVKSRKTGFWATVGRETATNPLARKAKPPKGILLAGISGCGKSHGAKSMGQIWGVPVLKLSLKDCKAQGQALVGQAQAKLQQALARAEAASPCILFIDEVDKDLDAASGPNGDGGTSVEMVGALLEWMNDHTTPVFTVLTANNVSKLQRSFPELFAAHRLDEKFFFNLPTPSERKAILKAHLAYYECDLSDALMDQLVDLTKGFISSELELVIRSSALVCLNMNLTSIDFDVLVTTIKEHTPFTSSPEAVAAINELQQWAMNGGVKLGSNPDTQPTKPATTKKRKTVTQVEGGDGIQIQLD